MRLLVFGSRDWENGIAIRREIERRKPDVIIEGEARGADTLARLVAESMGIPVEPYPANWERYGRGAGPIRNQQMLDEGKPDRAIGFSEDIGHSRGSLDMWRRCRKAGIPVTIYQS